MARQRIHEQATTTADPGTVWELLAEGRTWPEWSPIEAFELERPGDTAREGIGAVRVLRNGRVTGRDTIAELVPDRRFAYTHDSSLPVRDYRGEVDLEPGPDGTVIHWRASFEPKIPLTGAILRRGLSGFLREMTQGLADGAARRAAVGA
jgi:hypothetical protein